VPEQIVVEVASRTPRFARRNVSAGLWFRWGSRPSSRLCDLDSPNVERNIENVRRLEDAFNQRDYQSVAELISDGFRGHNPGSHQVTLEELRDNNDSWHTAMPGKRTEVVLAFGAGDRVVARILDRGINTGGVPWLGISPNGKTMEMNWLQITRHDPAGRIVEMWAVADVPTLISQLGATLRWAD
jgi:predicted ester cyclase